MIFKYKNKFYKLHPISFLLIATEPLFKKRPKKFIEFEDEEEKTGPHVMSSEFVFAVFYIVCLVGFLIFANILAGVSQLTVPITTLLIVIAIIYGLIRGLKFIFKWANEIAVRNYHALQNIYKKLSKFKIVFYKIGDRWL